MTAALVVVGDSTGEAVWTSLDPGVVGGAVGLFERVWHAAARPLPEGEEPPFTRRMVDIAFLLVDGATDREIARALGVSERTVSADVREMSSRLGARSRAHAIASSPEWTADLRGRAADVTRGPAPGGPASG